MGLCQFTVTLMAAATLGQAPAGPDYFAAANGAARELARQLQFLEEAVVAVPRPAGLPWGDGLFQQVEGVQSAVIQLREQLAAKVGREQLALNFASVDAKLNAVFNEIKGMERWNPGLRMVARRTRYAQHDLAFAIAAGSGAPATAAQGAYRQTLVLENRTEDLLGIVRYVFAEQDVLPAWTAEFADFRGAVGALQKLQRDKAPADALRQQVAVADACWAKLVARFNRLPAANNLLLASNFAQVDATLARLSALYGVKDRRAPLRDPFS